MPIQAVSVGHALDVARADVGIVHSLHSHAVNVEIRADLWTLLAADRADLPFGIRTALQDLPVLRLRAGDPVHVRSGFVGIGSASSGFVVDCRAAARWVPAAPDRPAPGLVGRLAVVAAIARGRGWHGSGQTAHAVMCALDDPHPLGDVLAQVVGRGPGLTPAGDDVLVGVLAVLTSPLSGVAGAEAAATVGRLLRPLLPTTTDVSGHLLRQAANGLVGRAVHELISALVGDPAPEQLRACVRRVVETGATSGADTCAGVLAAAPRFLLPHLERAAA